MFIFLLNDSLFLCFLFFKLFLDEHAMVLRYKIDCYVICQSYKHL